MSDRQVASSLLRILLLGAAGVAWALRHTDWLTAVLPAVLGSTALGALLTFAERVGRLLPEELGRRVHEVLRPYAGAMKQLVLRAGRPLATASVALAFLLVANLLATVQVDSGEAADRTVHLTVGSASEARLVALPHGGRVRVPLWTWWWSPSTVLVKIGPYHHAVLLYPWAVKSLRVPDSFTSTVILVRPTPEFVQDVAENRKTLWVRLFRKSRMIGEAVIRSFDGHPVWIGCDADVPLPKQVQELIERDFPNHFDDLLHPLSVGGDLELREEDRVDIKVLNEDPDQDRCGVHPDLDSCEIYTRTHITALPLRGPDNPQIEPLHME